MQAIRRTSWFSAAAASSFLAASLIPSAAQPPPVSDQPIFFYRATPYGSASQFNPISASINYALDPLQVPESFDDQDFAGRAVTVWKNLTDPIGAVRREGSGRRFVNSQLFPIPFSDLDERIELIPNYALHVLGGGMLYRKKAEWFRFHGYPYPRVMAATLSMAAEFVHEVVEKKSTADDDEIADFYFMRPLGIALFSWDAFARFAAEQLQMAEWPYQPMVSPRHGEFMNVGQNWIVRPSLFGLQRHRPFLFYGMTTLLGTSHQLTDSDSFSLGVGPAVRKADPDDFQFRWSGGIFYDRNDSLLGSLMLNGTENLALRLNVYPGALVQSRWFPGIFLGLGDDSEISLGLSWRFFPVGISHRIATR